ncbi:MAG: hypothetical protein NXI31_13475 [bacterium]|nr:hypothetical protein [bacterium]
MRCQIGLANLGLCALSAFLAPAITAQTWSAALQANQPLEIDFNGLQSHPAGPLTSGGQISQTVNLFGSFRARTNWVVPTANDLGCNVTIALETGTYGSSPFPATFQTDTTLQVSGPVGGWGTVEVDIVHYGGTWPIVDIGADGSNDAELGSFYGGVGPGSLSRSWSIPVQLTQPQLPIKILHSSIPRHSETYQSVSVRFVPWSSSAIDLGSSCPENHTGWIIGENDGYDYGLTVRPGTGSAAAVLHARGWGQLQGFVLGSAAPRLPIGTLALGHGCDDLLTNVIVTVPGTPSNSWASSEWTIDVPPMPPGLTFYLQHVSLGSVAGTTYFGATNVARYQT